MFDARNVRHRSPIPYTYVYLLYLFDLLVSVYNLHALKQTIIFSNFPLQSEEPAHVKDGHSAQIVESHVSG